MSNELKGSSNDYKFVWNISNRFLNDRVGLLISSDSEKRNRGSEQLGAGYGNAPAELDSVNQLKLTSVTLSDIERINDRANSLNVLDVNIPNGNSQQIKSTIDKDEIYRTDNYPVTTDSRYYDTGDGAAEIKFSLKHGNTNRTYCRT